jgi:hypothetical protein
MKRYFILLFLISSLQTRAQNAPIFDQWFENHTLRIDYYHIGDADTEIVTPDKIYRQGIWAGNPENCIQPFELGMYKVSVYDSATNTLIYSKGYNSLFAEYKTTTPALKGTMNTFHESVLIPSPLKPFTLVIERRDKYNVLHMLHSQSMNPADYHISQEKTADNAIIPIANHGDPHHCVDLAILAEGYRAGEQDSFIRDLKYFSNLLFSVEPFKSNAQYFNINGVFSASEESGTDEPRQGIYRNTRLNSSFNTFDLDRYCTSEDNKSIRDVAASVPYDVILVLVNSERYGGGGIFNWETVFTKGSDWRDYVFLHEFGHGFAGLADEYYASSVAYVDFYTPGVEPLEANITGLPDPKNVKWKKYLSPGIKVPTEWGKAKFDSLQSLIDKKYNEMISKAEEMKHSGQSDDEINRMAGQYKDCINKIWAEKENFIINHPLRDKVGVFEGANYISSGVYRPTLMSLMHSFEGGRISYDVVNEQAILSMIHYYTGQH